MSKDSPNNNIYPKKVTGKFRKLKWQVMCILLAIYYFTPWIRWERAGSAPDQAILIDLPNRKAYFFMIEIWPQEIFYIAGILFIAAIALFFVTSLFGRIWCGYSCPQTVWTDLFILVERIFQGDRNERMKLDKQSLSFNKIWRKSLTHISWIIIGLFTGGAWVLYFNDAPTIITQIINFNLPFNILAWIIGLTFSTYIMAGYARETVCAHMCPYARFQSAMFDKNTLIIGYDNVRGEIRGKHKQGDSFENRGHCIDCKQCVNVCPQGIDIRNGLQMECIACALCIDACDDVMSKMNLPSGLIRYDVEHNFTKNKTDNAIKVSIFRVRTFYYISLITIAASLMLYSLISREEFDVYVSHDRDPLYVQMSDGSIRNGYNLKITNRIHNDKYYNIRIAGIKDVDYIIKMQDTSQENIAVKPDEIGEFRFFIITPKLSDEKTAINVIVTDKSNGKIDSYQTFLISPKANK
jgi:cytochrome c oxidase accessory protein FixG